MSVLLDSVILIDHLNGVSAATEYLRKLKGASISVVTRAEVLSGPTANRTTDAAELLDVYPTLPIAQEHADIAAELRRKYRWKLADAFQAALAQVHGLRLATRNTRDFPPERHKFVIVPYRLE
jgi:predicted nucleic acid-binding protein